MNDRRSSFACMSSVDKLIRSTRNYTPSWINAFPNRTGRRPGQSGQKLSSFILKSNPRNTVIPGSVWFAEPFTGKGSKSNPTFETFARSRTLRALLCIALQAPLCTRQQLCRSRQHPFCAQRTLPLHGRFSFQNSWSSSTSAPYDMRAL